MLKSIYRHKPNHNAVMFVTTSTATYILGNRLHPYCSALGGSSLLTKRVNGILTFGRSNNNKWRR